MKARFILEILIVIIIGVLASHHYLNFDPGMTLHGREAQWLTSSAQWVAQNLREVGYVPYWQPYLSRGVPALEDAFSFAFNPVAILPSVVFGYPNGIKLHVAIFMIAGGMGGLVLGYALGLQMPARLLLGLLLLVRGPSYAVVELGHIQLGITQYYLPWVTAAVIALVRRRTARWTPIGLGLVLALLFLNGNIYYMLPAVLMTIVVVCIYLPVQPLLIFRKALVAFLLMFGIAAVVMLPVVMTYASIGRHNSETDGGRVVDLTTMGRQLFDPYHHQLAIGAVDENYYLYTMPAWLGLVVFIVAPIMCLIFPEKRGENWRIWLAGMFLLVFFGLWGIGSNPIISWLRQNFPLFGQWRVSERMLTVAGFWVCVFAAINFDHLWRLVQGKISAKSRIVLQRVLLILIFLAPLQVITTRAHFGIIVPEDAVVGGCVTWLRQQYPDKILSVFMTDYSSVTAFIRNRVRLSNISADYDLLGAYPTLFLHDLSETVPEYLIPVDNYERLYWLIRGYYPVFSSPPLFDVLTLPCLWHNPNTLAYAFTMPSPQSVFFPIPEEHRFPIDARRTMPIEPIHFEPGKIAFRVANSSNIPMVLVVQEIAWQGWTVSVNGQPAQLESVGQLIGVILPAETPESVIVFEYTAPLLKLGGFITIITGIGSIIYLLRGRAVHQDFPDIVS